MNNFLLIDFGASRIKSILYNKEKDLFSKEDVRKSPLYNTDKLNKSVVKDEVESIVDSYDNIDAIVSSTYRQGLSDGQKNVVQNASNIQAQVPNQSTQNDNNPLEDQLKNIMGKGSNKLTFKI